MVKLIFLFSKMCLVPKKRTQCFTLAKGEKPLAMFIENCVKEILMENIFLFDILCWNKILPTRGSVVSEIKQSTVW